MAPWSTPGQAGEGLTASPTNLATLPVQSSLQDAPDCRGRLRIGLSEVPAEVRAGKTALPRASSTGVGVVRRAPLGAHLPASRPTGLTADRFFKVPLRPRSSGFCGYKPSDPSLLFYR